MIVDSMTHEEVYKELERDRDNLTRWWDHQKLALVRPMLKRNQFPVHLWYDYTSPRKNRYMIHTRIFDKRMKKLLTGIFAIRRTAEGITTYSTWLGFQRLISPMILTPHMFKRYSERMGVDKTGLELIKHYFAHNPYGEDSRNQEVIGRSVRYNGEEHRACCTDEGVLLGQDIGIYYLVRTFITYDMCAGIQKDVFEYNRKFVMTDREMYEIASKIYN